MFEKNYEDIKLVEVGPRDGLQNEKKILDTKDKLSFITMLVKAGLKNIEVTSFVNPKAIPQMNDAEELFGQVKKSLNDPELNFPALVPNQIGYEKARDCGVTEIALFSSTSDTFNKKNINCTVDESFERMKPLAEQAKKDGLKIRAYISTAFGCPYEGDISIEQLTKVINRFKKLDVDEISVGDTTGVAMPKQVHKTLEAIEMDFGIEGMAMHFHDTRGMALSNILVSLERGIHIFDSSAGGLGGCPYAKGASGNVATEDVLYLLESFGVKTGVNMDLLLEASLFALEKVSKEPQSKFIQAYLNSKESK